MRSAVTATEIEGIPRVALSVEFHPFVKEWDAKAERVTTPLAKGKIVWRRWGSGPPIIFVHGGSGSWTHWIRNIEPLSRHYTVWAPDLPGHGDSDPFTDEDLKLLAGEEHDFAQTVKPEWKPQPIPMPALARALARAIETIIPEGKITLIGFSFGGMTSSNIAALIPHRIERVVLCGAAGFISSNPVREQMDSWRQAKTIEELEDIQRRNSTILMLHDPKNVDDVALNLQIVNTARTQARKPRRKGTTIDALRKAHAAGGVRLAGIWGEFDAPSGHIVDEISATLRSIDPTAPFDVIKGAGHWVAYEGADDFNRSLIKILKT